MIAALVGWVMLQGSPSDQLLSYVATQYSVPGTGGQLTSPQPVRGVPDPQKYIWPKVIARLRANPQDVWARGAIGQFWKAGTQPSAHAASFYHFAAIGLVRLLGEFPEATTAHRAEILAAARKEEQLESADGTENHRLMWRSSGYLLAEMGRDEPRRLRLKKWLGEWVRQFYRVGNGEWDSSTYASFSVAAFANLYDFAQDRQVREWAKAALDGYAASLALKWYRGVQVGAESRGGDVLPGRSIASVLGWIWGFGGDEPVEGQTFAHNVIPAISRYRPPAVIVALAQKPVTLEAFRTHPDYLMTRGGEALEILRVGRFGGYGVALTPQGGWAADTQTTLWKWAGGLPTGTVTGAGAAYAERNGYEGFGRSPWDQVVPCGAWVVQMTRVPPNARAIETEIRKLVAEWAKRNDKVRFPELIHEPWAYAAFRNARRVETREDRLLADFGNAYVAAFPLNRAFQWDPQKAVARTSGPVGELVGFAYRFGDHEEFDSFEAFTTAAMALPAPQAMGLNVRVPETGMVATFVPDGRITEPLYDWGTPPEWPSGSGFGRVPVREPALPAIPTLACDSPYLKWGDGKLVVRVGNRTYRNRVR